MRRLGRGEVDGHLRAGVGHALVALPRSRDARRGGLPFVGGSTAATSSSSASPATASHTVEPMRPPAPNTPTRMATRGTLHTGATVTTMYPGTYAATAPDRPAVIMGGSREVVTYGELNDRSIRLARILRDAGLQRGDHVALFMENQPRFLEVAWAALRSGLYITAVNSYLTVPEVAYIVNDCEAKAFITSAAKAEVVAGLTGETTSPMSWSA